jgi:hypothetical protein
MRSLSAQNTHTAKERGRAACCLSRSERLERDFAAAGAEKGIKLAPKWVHANTHATDNGRSGSEGLEEYNLLIK